MGTFSKWTEIESIFRLKEILSVGEVVATEKIHGTSMRIGCIEGVIRVGGRNEEFDFALSNPGTGMGFMGWLRGTSIPVKIKEVAAELEKDIIFYGEWHGVGIQKGIRYFAQEKGFRIFGLRINEDLQDWDKVAEFSAKIGVPTVPVLYRGAPNMEVFDRFRLVPSVVAKENGVDVSDNIVEGIVISAVPMQRIGQSWLIAKHKNPKFAERASEKKAPEPIGEGVMENGSYFVNEFWTAQRLEHVLTYLREKGIDIASPTAIGQAIRGMFDDVMKEGQPEWQALSEETQRIVGKIHPSRTKELLEFYWRESNLGDNKKEDL